jgi:hypothetical protein
MEVLRLNKFNLSPWLRHSFSLRIKVHISAANGLFIHTNFVSAEIWSFK